MSSPKRRSTMFGAREQSTTPQNASQSDANVPVGMPGDSELPRQEIARLAYSFWENRQADEGSPEDDWLRAENELRAKREKVKTAGTAAAGSAGA
jgi:hypothetical protein